MLKSQISNSRIKMTSSWNNVLGVFSVMGKYNAALTVGSVKNISSP